LLVPSERDARPGIAANLPDRTRGYNIDADHRRSDRIGSLTAKKFAFRLSGLRALVRPRYVDPWNIVMIRALPCPYSEAMLRSWNTKGDAAVMAKVMGA
jgi:hypothetical protein